MMSRTPLSKAFAIIALATTSLVSNPAFAAKDALVMGMSLEPPHLDPTAGAAAAIDEIVYANVFEGLTRIGANGQVLPALAESWEISTDGLEYTFKLRQGVKFHNDTDFDSTDAKFSLDRARGEESTNAQKGLFKPISNVEIIDRYTLKVTLASPTGGFLFSMGWGDAIMVGSDSADTNKEAPVGTGPFKLSNWIKGSSIELSKNLIYWGNPTALSKATFRFIPDAAAATAALLAGDVDAFANFPAPESIPVFKADARFTVEVGSTEGETILAINNKEPPFDNLKVRQAIAHTLDRQAIIDGAMFGLGTPIGTHFAPHHPAYLSDLINTYPRDLDKAKALLKEAGFEGGINATLKLPPPTYARRGGEIIASQLRDIGIDLEIIPLEWKQWLEGPFKAKDFDMTIVSHTEPMDIGIYGNPEYYFQYGTDAFKAVMTKLDQTTDTAARYALMGEAQTMITKDAVNGYLFELAKAGVWNSKINGLWKNSPVQANDLTGVSWSE